MGVLGSWSNFYTQPFQMPGIPTVKVPPSTSYGLTYAQQHPWVNPLPGPAAQTGTTPAVGATDYNSLLNSLLAPLQAAAAGASAMDAAALKANQQRAIIQFGENIAGGDKALIGNMGGIDKNTLDLARKNTDAGLSVVARLGQTHSDALQNIRNVLGGRGLIRSGETGYQMGREQTAYTQSQYDARQKVLDYLAGIQSAFVAAEQQRQWALASAAMQAGWSIPQSTPPYPGNSGAGGGGAGGAGGGGSGFGSSYYPEPTGAAPTQIPWGLLK